VTTNLHSGGPTYSAAAQQTFLVFWPANKNINQGWICCQCKIVSAVVNHACTYDTYDLLQFTCCLLHPSIIYCTHPVHWAYAPVHTSCTHILYAVHASYTRILHTVHTSYTHILYTLHSFYTHILHTAHTSCTHLLCIHPVHTCALYTLLYTHLVRCTHAPVRCTHILYTVRCTHDPEHTLGEWRHLRDTSHGFLAQASYPRSFKGRGARGRAPNTRPS
jgi:hypothetical protein